MRLQAGGGASLPQGNLLFSVETLLSQSGSIVEGAETAAAAMAAAAAGQPPPAQVAAAVQGLKSRAVQAQQLVSALTSRAVGLGGEAGTDSALQAATAAAAPEAAPQQGPTAAGTQGFQPPRHRLRAALAASWDQLSHSQKLQAVLEPVPLPAVARQAAAAAGGALEAVDAAAKEAVEHSLEAVQQEERLAAAWGERAVSGAVSKAQAEVQSRLPSWLPQLRSLGQRHEQQPAAAPAPAAAAEKQQAGTAAAVPGRAGSKGAGSSAAAHVADDAAQPGGGRAIRGNVASIFGSVFSDLREGYVGLWQEAQDFQPADALACLKDRLAASQAAQERARAAANGGSGGAAAAKPAAKQQVAAAKPVSKQQVATSQPVAKRQAAIS